MYSVGAMNSMVADLHSGLRLGSPYDFETGSYKNSSGTENKSGFFQKISIINKNKKIWGNNTYVRLLCNTHYTSIFVGLRNVQMDLYKFDIVYI